LKLLRSGWLHNPDGFFEVSPDIVGLFWVTAVKLNGGCISLCQNRVSIERSWIRVEINIHGNRQPYLKTPHSGLWDTEGVHRVCRNERTLIGYSGFFTSFLISLANL